MFSRKPLSNTTELVGSGISFYPGKDVAYGALVRCDTCFAKECDSDPALLSSDPFFLGHTNESSCGGKSLALGLILTEERKLKCIAGHNQDWYRFKKTISAAQVLKTEAINIFRG